MADRLKPAKFDAGSIFFKKEKVPDGPGFRIIATGNVIKGGPEEGKSVALPSQKFEVRMEDGFVVLALTESGAKHGVPTRQGIEDFCFALDYTALEPAQLRDKIVKLLGLTA
jgi:hypothetical protein